MNDATPPDETCRMVMDASRAIAELLHETLVEHSDGITLMVGGHDGLAAAAICDALVSLIAFMFATGSTGQVEPEDYGRRCGEQIAGRVIDIMTKLPPKPTVQ